MKEKRFLPISREEIVERGWDIPDFVYVIGVDFDAFKGFRLSF